MNLNSNDLRPLYLQIAEGIEDDILKGILTEEAECYSQHQISRQFNINPATAAKGINVLVSEGILYKVRGLGMHISKGAKAMIQKKRKNQFFNETLRTIVMEASKLNISKEEIKSMIDDITLSDKEEEL